MLKNNQLSGDAKIPFLTKQLLKMRYFYLFIFVIFINSPAHAQNPIGLPQITNFTTADYKGGSQNWDIQQDATGVMYFANNEGLLTYNGQNWNIYPVPSNTVIRSVRIGPDGKIYVGAQDDLGYFFPNSKGVLKYTSLKYLIPKADNSFADVWNISIDNGKIFFRTNAKIFELSGGKVTTFNSNPGWLFLGKFNNGLYAQERTNELKKFEGNKWNLVCTLPKGALITAMSNYVKDTALIATLKDGLFLLINNKLVKK